MGIGNLKNHTDIMNQLYVSYGSNLEEQTRHVIALALVSVAESLVELTAIIKKADEDETR